MGLLERIKNLSDTDINQLLRSRDAERAVGKFVIELEQAQRRLLAELADLERQKRWLEAHIQAQDAQLEHCQEEAQEASSQGNDDRAREAESRCRDLKQTRASYQDRHQKVTETANWLREELARVRQVAQGAWAKKTDLLKARRQKAKTQPRKKAQASTSEPSRDARKTELLKQAAEQLKALRELAKRIEPGEGQS